MDVFISHSSSDTDLAASVIGLLRAALNLPSARIRCTSVDGYRLPAGATTDETLRREVKESKSFVGLLTPSSIKSTYVLFELGARWGASLHLVPLLGSGLSATSLRGPVSGLNALSCDNEAQLHQLVGDLATNLGLTAEPPASYLHQAKAVIAASQSEQKSVSPLVAIFDARMTGSFRIGEHGKEQSFFLLPLTIINKSTAPISPDYFSLMVEIEGAWFEFKNFPIPPGASWNSPDQKINIPNAAVLDIMKLGASLPAGEATSGFLMFVSPEVPLGKISKNPSLKFKMSVTDVLGTTFEVETGEPPTGSIGPAGKLSVSVGPKA